MSKNKQAFDYLLKLIIVGDAGVGKTCMLLRFSEENFQNSHIATIGIDFKIKTINLDGKSVKVQIWDTAGQERFRTITQTYYRGAHGVILAYDCTSNESFENISNWVQQVEKHAAPGVEKILIGNKSDMEDIKVIRKEQGEQVAKDNNMSFFETSALKGNGIKDAFEFISRKIIKNLQEKQQQIKDQAPSEKDDGRRLSIQGKKKRNCCKA